MILSRDDIVKAFIHSHKLGNYLTQVTVGSVDPAPLIAIGSKPYKNVVETLIGAGITLEVINKGLPTANFPEYYLDNIAKILGVSGNGMDAALENKLWEVKPKDHRQFPTLLDKLFPARKLDVGRRPEVSLIEPNKDGCWVLKPGHIYLAKTHNQFYTHGCVAIIDGRSSTARYGITVNVSSSYAHEHFFGQYVLELTVTRPVILRPNVALAKLLFAQTTNISNKATVLRSSYSDSSGPDTYPTVNPL